MTSNARLLELINKEIDGVNSPKESAKLNEYLEKDPEAKALYHDIMKVSSLLRTVGEVDVPRNLRANIINSIDPNRYVARKTWKLPKLSLGTFAPKLRVTLAYAFLAGLLVGVAIYAIVDSGGNSSDIPNLYGTVLSPGATEHLEKGDITDISLDQVSGTVKMRYSKDIVLAQLTLRTQREVEVVLEFDGNSLNFSGFGAQKTIDNNLSVGKGYFRLTSLGENKYVVVFSNKSDVAKPIYLKIFSSGSLLYEKPISTGPSGS